MKEAERLKNIYIKRERERERERDRQTDRRTYNQTNREKVVEAVGWRTALLKGKTNEFEKKHSRIKQRSR